SDLRMRAGGLGPRGPERSGQLEPEGRPPSPRGRPRFEPEMSGYRRQWVMAISLTLLLGEPPRPGTLLAEVSEELAAHGAEVTVRLPREQPLTLEHPRTTAGEPFVPDATLVDLARETGRVLGAHLLGVD